jgi:hypothetical protein
MNFQSVVNKALMKFGYSIVALSEIPINIHETKIDLKEYTNAFFALKDQYPNEKIERDIRIGIAKQLPIIFTTEEGTINNQATVRIKGSIVVAENYMRK